MRGCPTALTRRRLLAGGMLAPVLASCGTDLARQADAPLPVLAQRLGVCLAGHATVLAGKPQPGALVSGCGSTAPAAPGPLFQAASLTKPLAAYVALRLVRQGLLELQAPVSQYLPGGYRHRQRPFAGPGDQRADLVPAQTLARIPVASLLNHTAGLPNWTSGALAPQTTPGARWHYSGEGYLLLQAVIAAAAGQAFDDVVQALAFMPLGMHDSRLWRTDDIRGRLVQGSDAQGQARSLHLREPNAAASLHTTADDYARLLAAWLAEPALTALVLSTPVPVDPALGLSWGLGWGIEASDAGPCLWQWGNNPGFRAFAMVSLASGNGFVLLTNHERGMPLAAALARDTLPGRHGVFRFSMLG